MALNLKIFFQVLIHIIFESTLIINAIKICYLKYSGQSKKTIWISFLSGYVIHELLRAVSFSCIDNYQALISIFVVNTILVYFYRVSGKDILTKIYYLCFGAVIFIVMYCLPVRFSKIFFYLQMLSLMLVWISQKYVKTDDKRVEY